MKGLLIGLLVMISSMAMAQNKKGHSYAKAQASKRSSGTLPPLTFPAGLTIICVYITNPKQMPDGKLKTKPYRLYPSQNREISLSALKKDSLEKK